MVFSENDKILLWFLQRKKHRELFNQTSFFPPEESSPVHMSWCMTKRRTGLFQLFGMQRQELNESMLTSSITIKIAFDILNCRVYDLGRIYVILKGGQFGNGRCRYVKGKLDAVSIKMRCGKHPPTRTIKASHSFRLWKNYVKLHVLVPKLCQVQSGLYLLCVEATLITCPFLLLE